MAQPTIIGAGTNTKVYSDLSSTDSEKEFSLAIPEEAQTMTIIVAIDDRQIDVQITNLALTGVTGATKIIEITMAPADDPYRTCKGAFFDLTNAGAATGTLTATLSGANSDPSFASVVCTDGYLESFVVTQERQFDAGVITAHSGNMANNTMVYMMVSDGNLTSLSFSGTGKTDIYSSLRSDMSARGVSQATTASDAKQILYSGGPSGADGSDMTILFSSQPNPFADINPTGDIISHDIITN